jgi:CheY-like chemotaxis protein
MTDIFKGKSLLIVEDENDLREPLVEEFENLGCRVFEACNGADAFEIIKKEKIDAVISDIRMPGGDGIELLKNIKSIHHACPVVMLITGFSDLSKEDAYHLGAEAILSKPFDLDEIDLAVQRILTAREVRWDREIVSEKLKKTFDLSFPTLSEAITSGSINLGRGGLFVGISQDRLCAGDFVSLHIRFGGGELLFIEGSGVIRWVRFKDQEGLPRGCGVEFESLHRETKEKIISLTEALNIKPFIPKA